MIKEYSVQGLISTDSLTCEDFSLNGLLIINSVFVDQAIKIDPAIKQIKLSMNCEVTVTLNNPL